MCPWSISQSIQIQWQMWITCSWIQGEYYLLASKSLKRRTLCRHHLEEKRKCGHWYNLCNFVHTTLDTELQSCPCREFSKYMPVLTNILSSLHVFHYASSPSIHYSGHYVQVCIQILFLIPEFLPKSLIVSGILDLSGNWWIMSGKQYL
jgi:hypothetical protein